MGVASHSRFEAVKLEAEDIPVQNVHSSLKAIFSQIQPEDWLDLKDTYLNISILLKHRITYGLLSGVKHAYIRFFYSAQYCHPTHKPCHSVT